MEIAFVMDVRRLDSKPLANFLKRQVVAEDPECRPVREIERLVRLLAANRAP